MSKKLIALTLLVFTLAVAGVAGSTGAAGATPSSPGACHMLEANPQGLAGMDGSQGGKNMVPLVVASLTAGCTP
jgi:hypothetical protein